MDQLTVDEWQFWRNALAERRGVDTQPGTPRSGYYRVKNEAIAFWRDAGELVCWRSGTFPAPVKPDAIDELFGFCAPHPISFEDYSYFVDAGLWPDQVAPVNVSDDLPPQERADAELTAQREAMAKWIAEAGKIDTQEKATKAGNFADVFAKLEKSSDEARKVEKEPHLEAGRAVDAKWQPVVKRAAELKVWAKKSTEPFLIAEKARIAAEETTRSESAAKAAHEAEEARRHAEATGAPPPLVEAPPLPPLAPAKAKAGKVHLRTVTKNEIVALRETLEYLANMNQPPHDLLDVVQAIVNRLVAIGVSVPGVETRKIEVAA